MKRGARASKLHGMRSLRSASWLCASVLATTSSLAAASDADDARALFERGQAVAKTGKIAEACTLYEQSHKLAPMACGVIVNLAECTDAIGHTAESFSYYEELGRCATAQKQPERIALAKERRAALRKQVVALDFGAFVPSAASRLRVDGVELPRAAWTTPLYVSARSHTVMVETDGCTPEARLFDKLQAGSSVTVPVWSAKCASAPAASAAVPATPQVQGEPWPVASQPSDGSGWRTAGLITAGVGVLGIGAAGVGIVTSLDKTKEEKQSVAPTYNALGGAGLALVGAGAVMYFVLGKDHTAHHAYVLPVAGPQGAGFQAGLSW